MNLIEALRSLGNQIKKATEGINRRRHIYEKYTDVERFSVMTHAWTWRNNITLQDLLVKALLRMTTPTPHDVGPTITKWRSISPNAHFVIRCYQQCVVEHRQASTISQIEVETERLTGVAVSRDTVADILDGGVDLGLLKQIGNKSTYRYIGTNLFWEENFNGAIYKYMQPEVREFAKAVLTLHTMHDTAKMTRARERDGQQYNPANYFGDENTPDPHTTRLSIMENISRGVYDEVAKMLNNLEESDLLELVEQMKEKAVSKK